MRLHLIDASDSIRSMSFSVMGANVLRDFSIASLAGGPFKPLPLDFVGTQQDTLGISIQCAASSGDVFEAGIEVMQHFLKPVTLLSPAGGETYRAGQTVQLRWVNDTTLLRQLFF